MTFTSSDCCFLTSAKRSYRLAFEVTQFCPYSCEYCFTWSSPKRQKFEADIELVTRKLISLIQDFSVEDVLITGGEPLAVLPELGPLLSHLNSKAIPFSISSTLYSNDLFDQLCSYGPRAINLSVDPPVDTKAKSAFKSNFGKVAEKIMMVVHRGIPLKLTAVISRGNIEGVPSLLAFLDSQLKLHTGISKIAFKREFQIGHAAAVKPLTASELSTTYQLLSTWANSAPVPISFVNWSEFHLPLQSCPAGKSLICVMQNGDVTPCSLLYNTSRSFRVGSLLQDSPFELRRRLISFHDDLIKYNAKTEANTPACASCNFKTFCGGACLASLPITSNRLVQRTCKDSPDRTFDPQRKLLKDLHDNFHEVYSPEPKKFVSPKENLSSSVEQQIRDYVFANLQPTDLAHTIEHIDYVAALAKRISIEEGAATRITVPAAYFHDVAPREPAMHHMHTFKSAWTAHEFLSQLGGFSEDEILHIQYAIYTSSYGSHLLGYRPLSLEANVVRDADFLEAIGARGIARVFAFNQAHGAKQFGVPIADPSEYVANMDMNIVGPDETPILHFYTKLLKVESLLLTDTAKKLGKRRHEFMVDFLSQYRDEIDFGHHRSSQASLGF